MNNPPEKPRSEDIQVRINRSLGTFGLVAAILLTAVIGYLIINTLVLLTSPARQFQGAVSTQVSQVINPTPTITADPMTVVRQVRSLARLETSSYTIEKVITAESGEGPFAFLFGDRLLLVAQGEVIAGVDLARLDDDAVQIAGDSVFITLPAAEIFVSTLDNDETYVYDRDTGVFGQQIELESLARQEAEAVIEEAAIEDGILAQAQGNAERVIEGLILPLGFEEVVFVTGTPAPDQYRGE